MELSSYAELNAQRRRARSLYLELRAFGLSLKVKPDCQDLRGYRLEVQGLWSLSPRHADRLLQRVEEYTPGLYRILEGGRWAPDLRAVKEEGEA